MSAAYLTELARQWVAEQGAEASEHIADAIRELRAVGDEKGARLLMQIGQRIDLLDGEAPRLRRAPIRRHRERDFDPSA
jgi:hypothetical protein